MKLNMKQQIVLLGYAVAVFFCYTNYGYYGRWTDFFGGVFTASIIAGVLFVLSGVKGKD